MPLVRISLINSNSQSVSHNTYLISYPLTNDTVKAYNIFQEVRGSPRSTTERNQQLENNIRAAQDLRASLVSSSKPQGAADPVSKLVDVCESKAKELLDLLEYIRGTSAGAGSMGATIRALRKKGRVEKLHTSLKEDREALSHMIQDKLL